MSLYFPAKTYRRVNGGQFSEKAKKCHGVVRKIMKLSVWQPYRMQSKKKSRREWESGSGIEWKASGVHGNKRA